MPYLPTLLKKIDEYYRLAHSFSLFKQAQTALTMPDDPEEDESETVADISGPGLYPKIIGTANEFANRDIADEILLIAELYKKALEMGGGYAQVNRALNTALSNMDSLIDEGTAGQDELDSAENILNEVSKDLRQRIKQAPSNLDDATIMQQLKSVRNAFNQQAIRQEVESQPQKYVYNKNNDIGGDVSKQTGHITGPQATAGTPKKYQLELERLQDSLTDPEIANNKSASDNTRELIEVLTQLLRHLPATISASDQLRLIPDDKSAQQAYQQASNTLQELRTKRHNLRSKLSKILQTQELSQLESQAKTTNNEAEKHWLQQKIELQKLRLSSDVGKGTEIKWRKALINSTGTFDSHGDFQSQPLSEDTKKKILDGIVAGQANKLSKADYDRKRVEEKAKQEGREAVKRKSQKGGWKPGEKQIITNTNNFNSLINKLGPGINTAMAGASYYIARVKEGGNVELKEFIDRVAKSIQQLKKTPLPATSEQMAEYSQAMTTLREKAKNYILTKNPEAVASWEISIRLAPFFRKIDRELSKIAGLQKDGQWNLSEAEMSLVRNTAMYIARIRDIYQKQYADKRSNFNSVVKTLEEIQNYLEDYILGEKYSMRVRVEEPRVRIAPDYEPLELEEESSSEPLKQMRLSHSKASILMKWIEKSNLLKQAQAINNTNQSADKMAEDIFGTIFDEELNKLINKTPVA